ncbi:hypothetical protein BG005_003330 [Podila minutissima]|nr:hypothetical protein BG005_003330 [Podila minutissima]
MFIIYVKDTMSAASQSIRNTESMIAGIKLSFQVYKALSESLADGDYLNYLREKAMEVLANMDHHYTSIQTDLANIFSAPNESLPSATRTEMKRIQDELVQLKEHAHKEDALVRIEYLSGKRYYVLERQPARLFFVLPAGINTSETLDPASPQLRLYFLCECKSAVSSPPRHTHISTHIGHDIVRGTEFLETFGGYVQTVLEMILYGYSDNDDINIGSLESMQALDGLDATVATKVPQLSKDHFPRLVKETIEFLRQHALRKLKVNPDPADLHRLPSFLGQLEENRTALGRLYRVPEGLFVYWVCTVHFEELIDGDRRAAFQDQIHLLGGVVDKQQGAVEVELNSSATTEDFRKRIAQEMGISELRVVFQYQTSQDEVMRLLEAVGRGQVSVLALGGVPFGTLPPSGSILKDMASNTSPQIFSVVDNSSDSSRIRTFLGSELVYGWGGLYLTTKRSPIQSHGDNVTVWKRIENATADFRDNLIEYEYDDTWEIKAERMVGIFDDIYDLEISDITLYNSDWRREGSFEHSGGRYHGLVDVRFPTKLHLSTVVCAGVLERLLVDEVEYFLVEQLGSVIRSSPRLSQIKAEIKERELLRQILFYLQHYDDQKGPMEVILFEPTVEGHERILATIALRHPSASAEKSSSSIVHLPGMSSSGVEMVVKEWRIDYLSWALQDDEAYILDKATEQHPSVLTSFTLDTTSLSAAGLACVANTLGRSDLWDLDIMCNIIDPSTRDGIQDVMTKVQWSALQFLNLVGENAEQWLWTLCTIREFRQLDTFHLQRFEIRSKQASQSNLSQSNLSPSSFFWIHQLIEQCPVMELILQNVFFTEERSWPILIEAIDSSLNLSVDLNQKHIVKAESI